MKDELGKTCQSIMSGLGYVPFAKGGGLNGEQIYSPHFLPLSPSTSLDTSLTIIKVSQELLVDGPVSCRGRVGAGQGCRS